MKVIVSGATGQDGSFMCEYLLENTNHIVLAGVRRTSQLILSNLQKCLKHPRFKIVPLELTDSCSITTLIKNEQPDFFINFGASSFVADSWNQPSFTMAANANSVIDCLEAIKTHAPKCRFYSAGSSEEWGDVHYSPQDINHPKSPRSIYGVSKVAAGLACKVYRESYGIFAIHGILTNHESERRQRHFVTRKITSNVARIANSISENKEFEPIELGNVNAKRDWSHSKDFIEGIWLMLNQPTAKEYVLSSGETHSIREFVEKSFKTAGIDGVWVGQGEEEKFIIANHIAESNCVKSSILVSINPKFYRPAEVDLLMGDSTPIREELGWSPKISFDKLIECMLAYDLHEIGCKTQTQVK